MKNIPTIIKYLIFAAGIFCASVSHAATLTVTPSAVTLDTQGETVNAVSIHLAFDPQEFSIKAIDDGGSIVNLWIEKPTFSNAAGTVDLAGIIPGGIATANGRIIAFVLEPKRTPAVKGFTVTGAQILLNDGKGTAAALTVKAGPGNIISPASSSTPDLLAPDSFLPVVGRDPSIFNGDYFVAFAATDQGSGVDHYEVLEVPQGASVGDITVWQTASSPYLLHDQALQSDIYVRAVDKNGNFRMVKIPAATARAAGDVAGGNPALRAADVALAGSGVLLIGISLLLWKRRRRL